jgi:hypothetical protein
MDATTRRRALLDAAEPALRAEKMGPTDFARITEMVEWRFLRRDRARFLGLPESERRQYQQIVLEERLMSAWSSGRLPPGSRINGRDRATVQQDLERQRERIKELDARAEGNTALTEPARAALEAHRADLESLHPDAIDAMTPLTAEPVLVGMIGKDGDFHVDRSREWQWPKPGETSAPSGESAEPSGHEAPESPGTAPAPSAPAPHAGPSTATSP